MLGFDANVIERGIRGLFGREFLTKQKKTKYPVLCTVVDSDKEEEKYNAISTLPQLSEIKDERVLAGFSEYSYTLKNKLYGTGIRIPRRLFEFDQTGQIRTLVNSLGARVANFPDKLVNDLLTPSAAGVWSNGYDAQPFFGTSHDLGNGSSQSNEIAGLVTGANILTATTAAAREALIACFMTSLANAKAQMLEFTDDRGEPWHDDAEPEGLVLICHPRMEWLARTALEGTQIGSTSNVFVKQISKLMTFNRPGPFSENGVTPNYGTFYLAKVDTAINPLLFQRFGMKQSFQDDIPAMDQAPLQALSAVEIQSVMRTGAQVDAHTFFDDEFLFGARCIYSAGWGMWQNMVRVTGL